MDKKRQISNIIVQLFENYNITNVNPGITGKIADNLANMPSPTRGEVRTAILSTMSGMERIILESIDFSDSNFWIDQIIDIIKNK